MLIGVAAPTAWGLYRFNQILATLAHHQPTTAWLPMSPPRPSDTAPLSPAQYGSIFFITTIVCLAGAVIALFIGGRNARAEDVEELATAS